MLGYSDIPALYWHLVETANITVYCCHVLIISRFLGTILEKVKYVIYSKKY
jgi:hypothetical protein